MNSKQKFSLYKMLSYPPLGIAFGALMTVLLLFYWWIFAGALIILGMIVFAFRDRYDFGKLFREFILGTEEKNSRSRDDEDVRVTKKPVLKPCDECGSTTKHRNTCSKNPKNIKKPEKEEE